jgi:hypothetical protein
MNFRYFSLIIALAAIFSVGCKKANSDVDITKEVAGSGTVKGDVSGIWPKGSIQRVSGDIIIPEGKSLVIEEGVLVIMDTLAKPEIIVQGDLYAMGTAENPIRFTIEENFRTESKKFGKQWGGILAAPTCKELLLDNAIVEYGGATTTESSTSVKLGLYKAVSGENTPAIWFSNVNGKLVVTNSTFRFFQDDCTYIEGGKIIFSYNKFYTTGLVGGEGINIKSGCLADVGFNFFYATNTNALKLSNSGDRTPQAHVVAYNNTILNTGWRRPTVKGGGVWLEATVYAELYNNLFANARFGIKRDTKKPEDKRSAFGHNLYYGYAQQTVDQFQPVSDIVGGKDDVIGTKAGENNPLFVSYPLETATNNADYMSSWDFHLKAGSPALGKGTTSFTRNFPNGIEIKGITYPSPAPETYIGAFGLK